MSPLLARANMARRDPSPVAALFKTVSVLGKARYSNASTRGTKCPTAEGCARRGSRREALDFRFADCRKAKKQNRDIGSLLGWRKQERETLARRVKRIWAVHLVKLPASRNLSRPAG